MGLPRSASAPAHAPTVDQFLASAAREKLAAVMTTDYIRRQVDAGRREDFEKHLAAVPNGPPADEDRLD